MAQDRAAKKKYDAEHYRRPGQREKELAMAKEYYQLHREQIKEKVAAYRSEHREEIREYFKAYLIEHRDKVYARGAERRARKRQSSIGDKDQIEKLYRIALENKRVRCYLCGEQIPIGERHVDHIIPLAKGGKHTSSNLAIACAKCNLVKGAKMPEDIGILL